MSEDRYELIGDVVTAGCAENLDDMVAICALTWQGAPAAVLVESKQEHDEGLADCQIVLSPTDARRIAAALLNAADLIDEIAPLSICPDPTAHEAAGE